MASPTKSEPVDRTPEVPASPVDVPSRLVDSDGASEASPASGSLASRQSPAADDEDVSLDELMISDSNDGDELAGSGAPDAAGIGAASQQEFAPPDDDAPESSVESAPYSVELLEDDAAALAAAAAAQEAAAAAAAAEADARVFAASRASEPPPATPALSEPDVPFVSSPPAGGVIEDERFGSREAGAEVAAAQSGPLAADAQHSSAEEEATPAPPISAAAFAAAQEGPVDVPSALPPVLAPVQPPTPTRERPSTPPTAARRDGPLPSFDIPDIESTRRRGQADDDSTASRPKPRVLASPLQLSEVAEEDDDDAVTHIGLPVVPDAPSDYPGARGGGASVAGYEPVASGAPAPPGFETDLSSDARRATTRLVPRFDPAQLEQRRARVDTNPGLTADRRPRAGLSARLSSFFKRDFRDLSLNDGHSGGRRRVAWLLDTVLPPLSLVLFGSGIGAGIMLLQPDRGARAAQQDQTVQALKEAPAARAPTTLAERAEAGEGDALFKITNMPPNERSSALTLALERGYQAQKQNDFEEFARQVEAPSGLSTPNLAARFLSFATSPETMLPAFSHLLGWPGSTGPDVLYAVWEKAPGGNRAASLAQQLLHSADQRAKATPALITALDLRSATTCEDYLRVLPAVKRDGDQRCSATLRALKHTDGCGDDGQRDCFACLREGTALDDALKAIEGRAAPQL